jgi:triphosphoribosyl-dephospho-CoA synthase
MPATPEPPGPAPGVGTPFGVSFGPTSGAPFDPAPALECEPRHAPGHDPDADLGRRPAAADDVAAAVAALGHEALRREYELTPKPGLVDRRNTGAHRDMDLASFRASAQALTPFFAGFVVRGADTADRPADTILEALRPIGRDAERAMLAATGGVNTHKGSIFAFGLATGAVGRLTALGMTIDADAVCDAVAAVAAGLVARELRPDREPRTAGEAIHRRHGLTGARGEAASGFATVRRGALPVLRRALAAGGDADRALHAALLHLLEHNPDTNLVARGGLAGLAFARAAAAALRRAGGVDAPDFLARMAALDDAFIARNLSPGGSADLLALTWFLMRLPQVLPAGAGHRRR